MRITVLWEDQRSVRARGFGPHVLLVACLSDELGRGRRKSIERVLNPVPKKGAAKLLKALREDGRRMSRHGPVFAVVDRDKATSALKREQRPKLNCLLAVRTKLEESVSGDYDFVLLVENAETLVSEACRSLGEDVFPKKPNPEERDGVLGRIAWGKRQLRDEVRKSVPSFDRLVLRVGSRLRDHLE
jgi:hypothetical protein